MINEGKFGSREGIWLTIITISSKVFYTSPALVVSLVGNTSWYMTLISMGVALLGFSFIYLLLRRFPDKDIVDIFSRTLGSFLGFVFSAFLGIYLLFLSTNVINEFAEVVKDYVFPLTPPTIIIGIFVLGVLISSLLGLESLARFAKLSAYVMLLGYLLVLALGIQNYDINRLFPILGYGVDKILKSGLVRSSAYGEVIILAVFASSLQGTKSIKKIGYLSIIFSGIIISLSTLAFSLSFPYYIAKEITSPMYEMASLIDYGRFVQRIEPLFLFIWFISSFIAVSTLFYCFISIYCKMFRIQDPKPIAMGSSILLYTGALFMTNLGATASQNIQTIREYGSIPTFILPIFALAIGLLRKKGSNNIHD